MDDTQSQTDIMTLTLEISIGEPCLVWFCPFCVFIPHLLQFYVSTCLLMFRVDFFQGFGMQTVGMRHGNRILSEGF